MVRVLKQNASESAFILFRDSIGGHTGCNGFKQALPWTSMEEAWSQSLEHPFHQSTTYRYLNEIAAAEYTKHGIDRAFADLQLYVTAARFAQRWQGLLALLHTGAVAPLE